MLIPNHPADERLSALASREADAVADASLTDHVTSCARCTNTLEELGALRASLAALPDLRPHRPLRLLPDVADAPAASGGWARRLFAPILTAGAAVAVVGLVGTASPLLGGMAGSAAQDIFQSVGNELSGGGDAEAAAAPDETRHAFGAGTDAEASIEVPEPGEALASDSTGRTSTDDGGEPAESDGREEFAPLQFTDPPLPLFPILLFAGVAVMILAAVLRYVVAPRAG